ncbi:phage tail tape measure protein [Pseudobutyrivibrio sp.]|uniref:phage tail tape measure protein n=1 Tax=Pseudobutyrivibrio sp. TaxID=2014367 RepID=UPI001E06BA0D|nr:phage tail tape measure protein [Pseudobutyrivibrio sp.]MBE5910884.1 phage tail tape measure protein [Pseudobutyrivibrio sp.]
MANKTTYELMVKLGATTSTSWKSKLGQAERDLEGLNKVANRIMLGMAAGATTAAYASARAIADATETYKGFEQEMATVQSISGANARQYEDMREAALDAGRATVYTAEESASAFEYMSLAGWEVEESLQALNPILHLAAATQKELQTTSDLVTDSMNALGLEVTDLDTYLDKLIATNNNANTTAEQLMEGLVKAGGASRVLGVSLDDTITSLDILANNGLKAEEAGTALNSIFVRIAGNSTAIGELDRIGVSLWDSQGAFVGFEQTLININEAMEGMTDEEKAQSLAKIAGTRRYSQFSYLLDSVKETIDDAGKASVAWDELEADVENSSGALERMYGIATDTLEMAEARLRSAKEDMQIRVTDVFSDSAKETLFWLSDELPNATDSIVAFAEAHELEFAELLEDMGDGIEQLWEDGVATGSWIIKNRGALIGALKGVATGVLLIKGAVTGIKLAKLLVDPLNAAVAAGGLALVSLTAIVGALEDAEREATEASLAEHFGDIALSMDEIERVAEAITNTGAIQGMKTALEEFADADSFAEDMADALAEIDKYNWMVKVGIELTEEDEEDYQATIDDYVKNANDYIEQERYAVTVSLSAGLSDTENSADIISKVDEFYRLNQEEMASLGTQLAEAVNEAFSDGVLDPSEIDNITELQAKIAEVQARIAQGRFDAQVSLLDVEYDWSNLTPESFAAMQDELGENLESIKEAAEQNYVDNYAAITAAYTNDDGTMAEGYEEAINSLKEGYRQNVGEAELKAANAQIQGIMSAYADDDIQSAIDAVNASLSSSMESIAEQSYVDPSDFTRALDNAYLYAEDAAKDVLGSKTNDIEELYEGLQPTLEQLLETEKKLEELGVDVPQEYQDAIESIYSIGAAAGDQTAIYSLLGLSLQDNDEYAQLMAAAEGAYAYIPEEITNAMTTPENMELLDETTSLVRQRIQEGLENGAIDATISINAQLVADVNETRQNLLDYYNNSSGSSQLDAMQQLIDAGVSIPGHANGGIVNDTQISWLAEEGPEAVIPLDGSSRAYSLWQQAGQLLGVNSNRVTDSLARLSGGSSGQGGSNFTVSFNPVITVQGNASREDISSALSLTLEDLREMLTEIQREDNRVAFG